MQFYKERPYQKLENHARDRLWNYGVFGFDWRRPLTESSASFKSFILQFRERIRQHFGTDPIPNLTIVCHSMGGLVATHALRDEDFSGLGFTAVMTIATPFYGTSNQQDRYFVGEKLLKKLRYRAEDVVRIIASLPGPYTLMFLPKEVFDRDREKIGLEKYPQRDPSDNPCDPFDGAMKPRWPKVVRDHWQYIEDAKKE
jgi:pimeloyl-ACP methyl ester carboxylesterase